LNARVALAVAGLAGAMAIGFAAYGAHGLDGQETDWIEKGSRFQLVHAVALLAMAQGSQWGLWRKIAFWGFFAGMGLFSGSLYIMAVSAWKPVFLVPFGGTAYMLGWLSLAVSALTKPQTT